MHDLGIQFEGTHEVFEIPVRIELALVGHHSEECLSPIYQKDALCQSLIT